MTAAPTEPVPATPTEAALPAVTPTPVLAAMHREEWTQHSPNGQWTAIGLAALPPNGEGTGLYTRLEVARVDGSQTWVPVDTWGPWGLGYTVPAPLAWSRDGQAFYFTNRPQPDGCALFVNGGDLLRLDLATGQVTQLMEAVALSLSLSPDEARVAYVGYGDRGLIVRDLATVAEQELPLDLEPEASGQIPPQAGFPVWAPSGDRLALTIAHQPCGPSEQGANSIVVVDLGTGATAPVLDRDPRQFVTVDWPAEDRLRLQDQSGGLWTLNPATGELEAAAH
jgi:hypothetical protein